MTTSPPFGAGAVSVTVPMETVPPITDDGESVMEVGVVASICRVAVFETDPAVAFTVASTCFVTNFVLTVKVAEALPLATVTVDGTRADGLLLES